MEYPRTCAGVTRCAREEAARVRHDVTGATGGDCAHGRVDGAPDGEGASVDHRRSASSGAVGRVEVEAEDGGEVVNAPENPPAFPSVEQWMEWSELKADYTPKTGPRGGMSLRDYFTSKVLPVLISAPFMAFDLDAELAYKYADAMLAQRAK